MSISRVLKIALLSAAACSRFGPVYPPKPPQGSSTAVVDPTPSRMVTHLRVTSGALASRLDEALPKTGDGTFRVAVKDVRYEWVRDPVVVSFDRGRIQTDVRVVAKIHWPIADSEVAVTVRLLAEPVLNSEYVMKLQSLESKVESTDRRVRIADSAADVLKTIADEVTGRARDFSYSLRPLLADAYAKAAAPLYFDVGDTKACAEFKVLGVEAGPTIYSDGIEKDLALIVAPSVTMPCAAAHIESTTAAPADAGTSNSSPRELAGGNRVTRFLEKSKDLGGKDPKGNQPLARELALPPLSNVALVPSGPFTVTIPMAATYEELTKAMSGLFTNGKYFFSKEYTELYLEKPEVYASNDKLIVQMHIGGPVNKLGFDFDINGDIFFAGHPTIVDNEIRIPDLEPTIETKNLLLSIKALTESDKIRDEAREALRLDLSERLRPVRKKLSSDLSVGDDKACFRADIDSIEVRGLYVHATQMRMYVLATARTRVDLPCRPN